MAGTKGACLFYGDTAPGLPAQPSRTGAFALVLAVGLQMGVVNRLGTVEPVGYPGAGKIL